MPSTQRVLRHLPPSVPATPAVQLAQASRALWLATVSLMTAFMQQPAPAHRCLLARRIARNFETLAAQDCFGGDTRASFARLALRWADQARHYAPDAQAPGGFRGLLRALWSPR